MAQAPCLPRRDSSRRLAFTPCAGTLAGSPVLRAVYSRSGDSAGTAAASGAVVAQCRTPAGNDPETACAEFIDIDTDHTPHPPMTDKLARVLDRFELKKHRCRLTRDA